jgi:hypothetical protein
MPEIDINKIAYALLNGCAQKYGGVQKLISTLTYEQGRAVEKIFGAGNVADKYLSWIFKLADNRGIKCPR